MQPKEYQIMVHSNPLFDIFSGGGALRQVGLDTHKAQRYDDGDARGRAFRNRGGAIGVYLTSLTTRFVLCTKIAYR